MELAWRGKEAAAHFALHPHPLLPRCARSVTTLEGESDVLVVYVNAHNKSVAILIEDKIGAGFQPDQTARYRRRGEQGIEEHRWDHFWTCFVAPARYAKANTASDTRVNLQDLAAFFDGVASDAPAAKTSVPGVKHQDAAMTEYRRQYSNLAARLLQDSNWKPEFKTKCFSQDTWQGHRPGALLRAISGPMVSRLGWRTSVVGVGIGIVFREQGIG